MNLKKIDKKLFTEISTLGADKQFDCIVCGASFQRTKECIIRENVHIICEYLFINGFYCKATQKQIFSLSNDKYVVFISSHTVANSLMYLSREILEVDKTDFSGESVGVAFIDTGISNHFDFLIGRNRIKFFKDFVNDKKDCYDDNGHGTFVCGVCSGNGALSCGKFSGIAPRSNIFALKALNKDGEANASKILSAMEWIYDNHKKLKINVACMSFGSEPLGLNDPIMMGAEALWNDGVVVVSAAGNSGPEYETIKSPGISSKIITVGGIDDNRYNDKEYNEKFFEIAEFSSCGPAFKSVKPDIVAPSVDIVSCGVEENYKTLSGTSVATPMIAGIACLLLEKNKNLKPNQIKNLLQRSGKPLGFDKNMEGFGIPKLRKILNII